MQVGQGNLVIGLDINCQKPNEKYIASVYNAILGGGANSKLFQNVREKNSLAYTAGSTFRRQKNVIFIRCGIEIDKYEKALSTIKEQITDMADGNFTEEDIENSKKLIISSIFSICAFLYSIIFPPNYLMILLYYLYNNISNYNKEIS